MIFGLDLGMAFGQRDQRGQRRMARMGQADRKATVSNITTLYNRAERKIILKQHVQHVRLWNPRLRWADTGWAMKK